MPADVAAGDDIRNEEAAPGATVADEYVTVEHTGILQQEYFLIGNAFLNSHAFLLRF